MQIDREEEIKEFTQNYFETMFENIEDDAIVFPYPREEMNIILNRLAVLKYMQTIWDRAQHVHGSEVSFEDVVDIITTYYDMNYPYIDLPTGRILVVNTVSEFYRFANAIVHLVFTVGLHREPESSVNLNELVKGYQHQAPAHPGR